MLANRAPSASAIDNVSTPTSGSVALTPFVTLSSLQPDEMLVWDPSQHDPEACGLKSCPDCWFLNDGQASLANYVEESPDKQSKDSMLSVAASTLDHASGFGLLLLSSSAIQKQTVARH